MDELQKLQNVFHKGTVQKLLAADNALDVYKATQFYFKLEKCLMSNEYYDNSKMGPLLLVLEPAPDLR